MGKTGTLSSSLLLLSACCCLAQKLEGVDAKSSPSGSLQRPAVPENARVLENLIHQDWDNNPYLDENVGRIEDGEVDAGDEDIEASQVDEFPEIDHMANYDETGSAELILPTDGDDSAESLEVVDRGYSKRGGRRGGRSSGFRLGTDAYLVCEVTFDNSRGRGDSGRGKSSSSTYIYGKYYKGRGFYKHSLWYPDGFYCNKIFYEGGYYKDSKYYKGDNRFSDGQFYDGHGYYSDGLFYPDGYYEGETFYNGGYYKNHVYHKGSPRGSHRSRSPRSRRGRLAYIDGQFYKGRGFYKDALFFPDAFYCNNRFYKGGYYKDSRYFKGDSRYIDGKYYGGHGYYSDDRFYPDGQCKDGKFSKNGYYKNRKYYNVVRSDDSVGIVGGTGNSTTRVYVNGIFYKGRGFYSSGQFYPDGYYCNNKFHRGGYYEGSKYRKGVRGFVDGKLYTGLGYYKQEKFYPDGYWKGGTFYMGGFYLSHKYHKDKVGEKREYGAGPGGYQHPKGSAGINALRDALSKYRGSARYNGNAHV